MKTIGIISFIGLLAILMNCSTPETVTANDSVVSTSPAVDSLELARKSRVDSASQIKVSPKVKAREKRTIPASPKKVKQ